MNHLPDGVYCSSCKTPINTSSDPSEEQPACENCGCKLRAIYASVHESSVIRDGLYLKNKRKGEKKPFIEDMSMPSFSQSMQKHVHRQRIIDRENDYYLENIIEFETGHILHRCEEKLSDHKGHGYIKKKK